LGVAAIGFVSASRHVSSDARRPLALGFCLLEGKIMTRFDAIMFGVASGALALAGPVGAQEAQANASALRGTNCAQFMESVEMATASSRAGGKQLSGEELEAATEAQDELIITLFWVHGYQAGKSGQAAVLDQQWMARTVARMGEICTAKGNEKLPISEAVKLL
jgi:hypothetical protein